MRTYIISWFRQNHQVAVDTNVVASKKSLPRRTATYCWIDF